MKKTSVITLLGILFCLLPLSVQAQLQEQRHNFALGVNGGVNLSKVSFSPTIKQGYLIGPTFGVTARYISEKYFAMICGAQVELNISQRGWEALFETADGQKDLSRSYSREMTYLEIPFLAHLAFGTMKPIPSISNQSFITTVIRERVVNDGSVHPLIEILK